MAKNSAAFSWKSNGKVRFGLVWPGYSEPPLEVFHFAWSDWANWNLLFHFDKAVLLYFSSVRWGNGWGCIPSGLCWRSSAWVLKFCIVPASLRLEVLAYSGMHIDICWCWHVNTSPGNGTWYDSFLTSLSPILSYVEYCILVDNRYLTLSVWVQHFPVNIIWYKLGLFEQGGYQRVFFKYWFMCMSFIYSHSGHHIWGHSNLVIFKGVTCTHLGPNGKC